IADQVMTADLAVRQQLQRALPITGGVMQHHVLHAAALAGGGVAGVDCQAARAGGQQSQAGEKGKKLHEQTMSERWPAKDTPDRAPWPPKEPPRSVVALLVIGAGGLPAPRQGMHHAFTSLVQAGLAAG